MKQNKGAGGIDGQSLDVFEAHLEENLTRLHTELKEDTYAPLPVREQQIPKPGQPGKYRRLGIPTIFDRVCQQALLNRLEPIFEPVFDDANFGYRKGRSTKDALRKVWQEIQGGNEWIVDADLRDFFGSADHGKLLTLLNQRIADGRVLRLLGCMLKAGCVAEGKLLPTEQGTPQGGVISPLLSNVLLTPFDREMRRRGYNLTRYADDWVITCRSKAEAQSALVTAQRLLSKLGVEVNAEKTRLVHVRHGFEFLGFKIKQGQRPLRLPGDKIRSGARQGALYAIPRDKSIRHFKEEIRRRTCRCVPRTTAQLIQEINPIIRGWGSYYCKAHVRRLFAQLKGWIARRLWSHRYKKWRNRGWRELPERALYEEYGLVNIIQLIPSIAPRKETL